MGGSGRVGGREGVGGMNDTSNVLCVQTVPVMLHVVLYRHRHRHIGSERGQSVHQFTQLCVMFQIEA